MFEVRDLIKGLLFMIDVVFLVFLGAYAGAHLTTLGFFLVLSISIMFFLYSDRTFASFNTALYCTVPTLFFIVFMVLIWFLANKQILVK
jgi:hypothetical protein